MICEGCEEQGRRQQEQMKPRTPREGVVLIRKRDAFWAYGSMPMPDIRMGDVVRIELISAAVEDVGWCDVESCENYGR